MKRSVYPVPKLSIVLAPCPCAASSLVHFRLACVVSSLLLPNRRVECLTEMRKVQQPAFRYALKVQRKQDEMNL